MTKHLRIAVLDRQVRSADIAMMQPQSPVTETWPTMRATGMRESAFPKFETARAGQWAISGDAAHARTRVCKPMAYWQQGTNPPDMHRSCTRSRRRWTAYPTRV